MATDTTQTGKTGVTLLEEAVTLLRSSTVATLAKYYVGTIPFVLAFLFFWADMSQSAFAQERLAGETVILGFLFVWMKCWHAGFARDLMDRLCNAKPTRWSIKRICSLVIVQASLQGLGIPLLLLSGISVIGFPWVYATMHNCTVLADGESEKGLRKLFVDAAGLSKLWPRQNTIALLTLTFLALFVWLNIMLVLFGVPSLAKSFLGIETVFSQGGVHPLNTTFLAVTFATLFLCIDPIIKTFYTLRCFYGEALHTGQDLRSQLRSFSETSVGKTITRILLVAFLLALPGSANAQPNNHSQAGSSVSSQKLDSSIREVIAKPEYAWRLPREKTEQNAPFIESVFQKIAKWMKSFWKWLFDEEHKTDHDEELSTSRGFGAIILRIILFCLLIGIAIFVIWKAIISYINRRSPPVVAGVSAANTTPNLENEDVLADELPEDEWVALAKSLWAEGKLRLAVRATYLSVLASLSKADYLTIKRFKSNRDYERELRRRVAGETELTVRFAQTVRVFEDTWYGEHVITQTGLQEYIKCHNSIRELTQNDLS